MALDNLGRLDEAIERFRQAIKTQRPGSRSKAIYEAHYNLGNALLRKGDLDGAAEHFRLCLTARSTHVEARYNLAHVLLQKGQIDEGVKHLQGVLRRKPNHAKARETLDAVLAQATTRPSAE
jgi:tetratricopeptide (TPR) repeat protein